MTNVNPSDGNAGDLGGAHHRDVMRKKRNLHVVNEPFEFIFNAANAASVDFRAGLNDIYLKFVSCLPKPTELNLSSTCTQTII